MGNTFQKWAYPGPYPETFGTPKFDPHYGFSGERKERVMPVSNQALMDAHVPLNKRDYCAHLYLDVLKCQRKHFPFSQCKAEVHKYHKCEYEDDKLRMMEYERERRLLIREKRKREKAQAAAA